MTVDVASLVRRHMRQTSAFTRAEPTRTAPVNVHPEAGEELVGWYRNPPPWDAIVVLFTTLAIHVCEHERTMRVPLEGIVDFEMPASVAEATGLRIRTRDGFRFVRMAGAYGPDNKCKDVFSLTRLLQVLVRRSGSPA